MSLLDVPDEVRGTTLGTLDMDDEVVVLERRGGFCCVLSPDGHEGWIHRMTLGGAPTPTHAHETPGAAEMAQPERPGPPDVRSVHADLDPGTFEDILRIARELRGPSGAAP